MLNKEIKHGLKYIETTNKETNYVCKCEWYGNSLDELNEHLHQANLDETERIVNDYFNKEIQSVKNNFNLNKNERDTKEIVLSIYNNNLLKELKGGNE